MPKLDDEILGFNVGSESPEPEHRYTFTLPTQKLEPLYKFNEGAIIAELKNYIDSTYGEHYSTSKFQATEFIFDNGHGEGFCIGNIMKYTQRYGKKDGRNKKDLMKILHYAIMMVHVHNLKEESNAPVSTITLGPTDSNKVQGTLDLT